MKCFYHHDAEAVGTCKSCGRGLCPECLVEFDKGLACRGHCEADVQDLINLIDRNLSMASTIGKRTSAARRGSIISYGFFMVAGTILFLAPGREGHPRFIIWLGAAFVVYGLVMLIRVLRSPVATDRQGSSNKPA
jgi:hypothetical protein